MYEQSLTAMRPSTRPTRRHQHRLEWGPAHLRDDAPASEYEPSDRPEDN